jgi:hypothetical protein
VEGLGGKHMHGHVVERALKLLYQPIGKAAAKVATRSVDEFDNGDEPAVPTKSKDRPMGEALEKIGGSVMNLVLGALIVWVGQTTFQHAGILATVDEKFVAIDKQFQEDEKRHESMRKWLENVVSDLKDSNRSQFTQKEGDQLISQLRQVEGSAINLERKIAERLGALEVRLVALQASGENVQEVAALEAEVAQLRYAVSHVATVSSAPPTATTAPISVTQRPVYLPPVGSQR